MVKVKVFPEFTGSSSGAMSFEQEVDSSAVRSAIDISGLTFIVMSV